MSNTVKEDSSKKEITTFRMIKIISLIIIIAIVGVNFSYNKVSDAKISTVSKAALSEADVKMMQEADSQMFKRLYGLSANDFEGVSLYYPKTNMGSEEMLIVKLKDISQQSMVEEAVKGRLDTQLKNFDGYGTYQYGMLKKSLIEVKGNYLLFISGKNPEEVKHMFEKAL